MALVIDATPGGTDANSYITRADATTYFEGRLYSTAWDNATDADKDAALVMATRMLDQTFAWQGSKTTTTQALDWPRTGVVDCSGETVDSTIVPQAIKDGVCEQALALLGFDLTKKPVALFQGVKKASVGPNAVMAELSQSFQPDTIDRMTIISVGCFGTLSGGAAGGGLLTRY